MKLIITEKPSVGQVTYERWDEIFGDAAITSAIVDRLTYKACLIDMEGDSYRLRETLRNNGNDFETSSEIVICTCGSNATGAQFGLK